MSLPIFSDVISEYEHRVPNSFDLGPNCLQSLSATLASKELMTDLFLLF